MVKRGLTENSAVLIERQRVGHASPIHYTWFSEDNCINMDFPQSHKQEFQKFQYERKKKETRISEKNSSVS
ncbi:unnamed protein product [Brugia timori]|uniref:Uncharacterized protein n=1 Tax=Brugia timori TaxID=42155 RepID=A0A0R3Q531_9BILA|nr:unnamed protein product [Brugia timori]